MKTNDINIECMSEEAIETIRTNTKTAVELIKESTDNSWLKKMFDQDIFIVKKQRINDFTLKIDPNGDYSKVDYENSITLYETLHNLPRYILSDEGFWAWMNFYKCYSAAVQAMPPNKESVIRDHYLFTQGNRRGMFFGVLSRCYFRVELTVDNDLEDPYEITKFVIENPERFRNLTWRTFSSEKHIVLGALKAEKQYIDEHGDTLTVENYSNIAKAISRLGSVALLDAFSEEDVQNAIYNEISLEMETSNNTN